VTFALGACETPAPNVEPTHILSGSSGKGVAVGTIVHSGIHGHYRLYYRQIGGGESGFFQLSSVDPSENGALFAAELRAGDYEIYDWRIYLHRSSGRWMEISTPDPVSIPFHVSPGEAAYVGSCTFAVNGDRRYVEGATVECARRPDRDVALLQERYPSLSPIANSARAELLYRTQRSKVRRYSPGEAYRPRI
jgi:hypothetical protein